MFKLWNNFKTIFWKHFLSKIESKISDFFGNSIKFYKQLKNTYVMVSEELVVHRNWLMIIIYYFKCVSAHKKPISTCKCCAYAVAERRPYVSWLEFFLFSSSSWHQKQRNNSYLTEEKVKFNRKTKLWFFPSL